MNGGAYTKGGGTAGKGVVLSTKIYKCTLLLLTKTTVCVSKNM